jgi:hypothetical protein
LKRIDATCYYVICAHWEKQSKIDLRIGIITCSATGGFWMAEGPPEHPSPEERSRRVAWFHEYTARLDNQQPGLPLRCPCCWCKTFGERGGYEICPICFWEDDGQDDAHADEVWGGPNGALSLAEARANYRAFGASSQRRRQFVRPPRPEELPEYDPRDEGPVLEKLKAAGWVTRYWQDRQDLYAEWSEAGKQKIRDWRANQHELGLESENQVNVLNFYSRYLLGPAT